MTQLQHTQNQDDPFAGTPRHIWQSLFVMVSMFRPSWPVDEIADETFSGRYKHSFPEIASIALKVAKAPHLTEPVDIRFALNGVIAL